MNKEKINKVIDALKSCHINKFAGEDWKNFSDELVEEALSIMQEKLYKPLPEPVAYMFDHLEKDQLQLTNPENSRLDRFFEPWNIRPLYIEPPQKNPLSDDKLFNILFSLDSEAKRLPRGFKLYARAIERAHGIGENK